MGWDGMGWDGMGWALLYPRDRRWDVVRVDVEASEEERDDGDEGPEGAGLLHLRWDGMGWDRMGWDGM